MKKVLLLLFVAMSFGQHLDPVDIALYELKATVEIASRSNQTVFVDDFTGLL